VAPLNVSTEDSADFLPMDFGTTSLKTAIVDLDTGCFSLVLSHAALAGSTVAPGRYEVSPAALTKRFQSVCGFYVNLLGTSLDGIALCSEQNGSLARDDYDEPVTDYVSWKDERSLETIDGLSTFDWVMARLGPDFNRITGWRPGPNLPLMNLTHLGRSSELPRARSCPRAERPTASRRKPNTDGAIPWCSHRAGSV
jgi:sugar (pentulose or hexulose) kinase